MTRLTCSNWDSNWGHCGRCSGCLQRQSGEDARDAFSRIELRLIEIQEQLTELLSHAREKQS